MAITKVDSSMLEDVSGADSLVRLDANAKIPATSGASLSVKPGPLTSASDPAIDSNKALGTEWLNSTSGEMYICTDATAGANVWTNVGAGSGNVKPWAFQGTNYGYTHGGTGAGSAHQNIIDKFSLLKTNKDSVNHPETIKIIHPKHDDTSSHLSFINNLYKK